MCPGFIDTHVHAPQASSETRRPCRGLRSCHHCSDEAIFAGHPVSEGHHAMRSTRMLAQPQTGR